MNRRRIILVVGLLALLSAGAWVTWQVINPTRLIDFQVGTVFERSGIRIQADRIDRSVCASPSQSGCKEENYEWGVQLSVRNIKTGQSAYAYLGEKTSATMDVLDVHLKLTTMKQDPPTAVVEVSVTE